MNTEDDEFNRIEREAAMRKAAVHATVTKKEWIGLTDEEIDEVTDAQWANNGNKPIYAAHRAYARAIEAKLKEKNEM
jgi:uncharacterized damage-inducible protein DinB